MCSVHFHLSHCNFYIRFVLRNIIAGNIPSGNIYISWILLMHCNEKGWLFGGNLPACVYISQMHSDAATQKCDHDVGNVILMMDQMSHLRAIKNFEMRKVARNVPKRMLDESCLTWLDRWLTIGWICYEVTSLLFFSPLVFIDRQIVRIPLAIRIDYKLHI